MTGITLLLASLPFIGRPSRPRPSQLIQYLAVWILSNLEGRGAGSCVTFQLAWEMGLLFSLEVCSLKPLTGQGSWIRAETGGEGIWGDV